MCIDIIKNAMWEFVTINGNKIDRPIGEEVTCYNSVGRCFILPIRGFTKRFIKLHKYSINP